jgi:hypothetical protein
MHVLRDGVADRDYFGWFMTLDYLLKNLHGLLGKPSIKVPNGCLKHEVPCGVKTYFCWLLAS